jgi:cobalamin biosynthesis protein CbiG
MAGLVAVATLISSLTGCLPVALTGLGIGGSTGVNHAMNGMAYRTFSCSTLRVKKANLKALEYMQIKVESIRKEESSEIITAKTKNRNIEVTIEALSPNTTRIKAIAKDGASKLRK